MGGGGVGSPTWNKVKQAIGFSQEVSLPSPLSPSPPMAVVCDSEMESWSYGVQEYSWFSTLSHPFSAFKCPNRYSTDQERELLKCTVSPSQAHSAFTHTSMHPLSMNSPPTPQSCISTCTLHTHCRRVHPQLPPSQKHASSPLVLISKPDVKSLNSTGSSPRPL